MEPPGVVVPPDKDREKYLNNSNNQQIQPTIGVSTTGQQTIERLSRPMAFDKMECVVKEMQDSETGVPVRSQKLFLTSIPSAFMGYDLIEWLMERLSIEESEALNIANQLCLHGYFFPVNDSKTLVVKDDSSLYRFQTPYYWPWQHKAPDNVEYAIYLAKRSLRNKQRHGLEEYETEALANLHKNLKGKWDFITMQAEEQVKLAKERKKGDKIVGDSQERAYWRVHRPPPGQFTPLEACPVPSRDRQGKPRRRTVDDWSREVEILTTSLGRTRMKMSQACECLVAYCETFAEYDPIIQPALPSNPWVSEDLTFWQLNNTIVEIPTEKRVRRWAISIEEIVSDPTGLHEFTVYLKKEYSHENIRFWLAVNDLRRSSHSLISKKVKEIYEEFLAPGAPCEINIDGKTMENVQQGLKAPSRFAFDAAAEHIYALLLKKDCYPRFIRSEHYKSLIASGIQPSHKKRFFGFGGVAKKKSTTVAPNPALLAQATGSGTSAGGSHLARRRGSDRSLSGSAHELAVSGVKDNSKVPHSHSQSNLSDIPYRGDMPTGALPLPLEFPIVVPHSTVPGRLEAIEQIQEGTKSIPDNLETTLESGTSAICPWDDTEIIAPNVSVSICPWDDPESASVPTVATKTPIPVNIVTVTSATTLPTTTTTIPKVQSSSAIETGNSSASDICDVSERMRRSCGLRQNTLDCDFHSTKRLMATVVEHRRASVTVTPKISDLQFSNRQNLSLGATEKKGNITSSPVLKVKDTTKSNIGRTISFEDEELYNMLKSKTISEESLKNTNELNKNETINKINKLNDNLKTLSNINENNECKKVLSNNNSANLSKLTPESIASVKIESVSTPQALPPIINVVCPVIEIDSHELNESTESVDDTKQEVQIEQIVESSVLFKLEEEDDDDIQSENKLSFIMDEPILTEDLSPTTEEYQEGMPFQQTDQPDSEEYDLATGVCILTPGCVAPAPTPCNVGKLSQITAPLAEVEIDPPDDEGDLEIKQGCDSHEEHKKRKKKREKSSDGQEKQDDPDLTKPNEQTNRYAVCPWEDEDVTTTVDTPFVKTYSTLGYL